MNRRNDDRDLGEIIDDIVQSAIDDFDFAGMSERIRTTIDHTVDTLEDAFDVRRPDRAAALTRYVRQPGRIKGPILTAFGICGLLVCVPLTLAALFTLSVGPLSAGIIVLGLFLAATAGFASMFRKGFTAIKRLKRMRKYARIWKGRSYITIKEIAERSDIKEKKVREDLHYILEEHLLPEAMLDDQETCFILSNEAYSQYRAAEDSRLEREEEQAAMSPEEKNLKTILAEYEGYRAKLTLASENLKSVKVKEQVETLKSTVGRIYGCVEKNPGKHHEIYRLHDYYIPTMLKLLDTYQSIESDPVQGENIKKTKQEIEESLDMLNQALEVLYDDLFSDVAMDIESDVTVLETLLAQEGLRKGDFE